MSERRKQPRRTSQPEPEGDPLLDWSILVGRLIHPTKALVIEALRWINLPLAASDLEKVFDDEELNLTTISYHVRTMAKVGVLERIKIERIRGGKKQLYVFSGEVRKNSPEICTKSHGR
jgi:hypothetical protein